MIIGGGLDRTLHVRVCVPVCNVCTSMHVYRRRSLRSPTCAQRTQLLPFLPPVLLVLQVWQLVSLCSHETVVPSETRQGPHSLHALLPSRHTHTLQEMHIRTYIRTDQNTVHSRHTQNTCTASKSPFLQLGCQNASSSRAEHLVMLCSDLTHPYVHSHTATHANTQKQKQKQKQTNKQTNKRTSLNLLEVKAGVSNRRLFLQDSPLANISV